MQPFKYTHASNEQEALSAAAAAGAKYIGGGTNLLDLMKLHIEQPQQLVDINDLPQDKIDTLPGGGMRVGAGVRNSDLAYHTDIKNKYPVLSEALLSGASAQLRNMATVGGNLMQRTRCPYFYDTGYACNKRQPGTGCAAMQGPNRMHAILGTSSSCIATHPSDMCVALAALDAVVRVKSSKGERTIAVRDFHKLPGESPHIETALQPGELITAVDIPHLPFGATSHYLKVRDRASYEFALTSAAVAVNISHGIVKEARIALGGVGTRPWRCPEAEQMLAGSGATKDNYRKAAELALQAAKPHKDNAFKTELAKRTIVRALLTAGGRV